MGKGRSFRVSEEALRIEAISLELEGRLVELENTIEFLREGEDLGDNLVKLSDILTSLYLVKDSLGFFIEDKEAGRIS